MSDFNQEKSREDKERTKALFEFILSEQPSKFQIYLMKPALILLIVLSKIFSSLLGCQTLCLSASLKCLGRFVLCMMPIYYRHHREIRFKSPDFFLLDPRGNKSVSSNSSVNLKSLQIIKGGCLMVLFSEHPENRSENFAGKSEVTYTGKS